ncbi:MAG: vitamin B12 dependent-methionine synthase activation domain-containing protein [Faecalimonas sp.]|nr:vitamin B12 dependent-methionine synthase activation domain-containing protein [Faecalimonas sp.]
MDRRTREAIRYLGYGTHAIDERALGLIQQAFAVLDEGDDAKFTYRIFEISKQDAHGVEIGNTYIESKQLAKNLKGCHKAILFAATLGVSVDLQMKQCAVKEMTQAVVLQACATAYLEEFCDACQKRLGAELGDDLYLRPRFSPGYGDFSILYQKELLQLLEAAKRIGLTMTDSYMLTPTKSVTAVIGISRENTHCHQSGCEECTKTDCVYRRGEVC